MRKVKLILIEHGPAFLFFLIVYGNMFIKHYASDTYSILVNNGFSGTSFAVYGRFGCEIVYGIVDALKIDYETIFPFLIACVILSLAFFCSVVAKRLISARDNISETEKTLFWLGAAAMVCNPFVSEWLQYWEGGFQWSFCLIFSALAINILKGHLGWKKFITVTCLEFCSLSFYQASLALFLISGMLIVYVLNDGKLTIKSLKQSFWIIASGGCASILNLIGIKLYQVLNVAGVTPRTGSITPEIIWNNVQAIISSIPNLLINLCHMYPKYLFLIALVIMLVTVIINLTLQKEGIFNKLMYIALLLAACFFSVFLPHIMTTDLWIVQRTIVAFWGILGAVEIFCAVNVNKGQYLCIATGGLACLVCILFIQIAAYELITTNLVDREMANVIEAKIREYENDTGQKVTAIYIRCDEAPVWKYSFVEHSVDGDMTRRAFSVSWSDVNCINYYSSKNYIRYNMDDETYFKYFENGNWDYFNIGEQTHFEGDTLYLICY